MENIRISEKEELLKEKVGLERTLDWYGPERNYEYFVLEERLDEINKILENM